jgi:signal transduction histidine kinase
MLAQRDQLMMRFANRFAANVERAMVSGTGLPSPDRLSALADEAHQGTKPVARTQLLLIDAQDRVVFSYPARPERGVPTALPGVVAVPLADGTRSVVTAVARDAAPSLSAAGLQVVVTQPDEQRGPGGGSLQEKLTAISILLSITAALVGAAFARRLTRRLGELTRQVQGVARQQADGIVLPTGRDEVATLGRAFSRLLVALQHEHEELDQLTRQLEQRVNKRTREVERLAEDARYAAVVRERLRLARDLHDTLAHSMMEMLAQVRTLRVLHEHDPRRLGAELERAEELARQGLKEAREAVSHMRVNAVRDFGLGSALKAAVNRFAERTGLEASYMGDAQAESFADARAETMFRIAEESLRNIDRHAQAKSVTVTLRDVGDGAIELTITDDGVGFDPAAELPGHYGVLGIREQAELIGGELELRSAPGAGATVKVRLRVGPEMRAAAALPMDKG